MELNFTLHPSQMEIMQDDARFQVVAAGRRFGKSFYAAIKCLIEGLKDENDVGKDLSDKRVFYVAPTFDQGKRIIWDLLKSLGKDVIKSTLENQGIITLINGRKIEIKGADRPDTLRGVGLSFVVLDEYAFMKDTVWEQVIRPTLSDVEGKALFIGTPSGKNHFYRLYVEANKEEHADWSAFSFKSVDNPTLPQNEILHAKSTMSTSNYRQEYEATFSSGGGALFKEGMMKFYEEEPQDGFWYVAVDPAGFEKVTAANDSRTRALDECAIVTVKVTPNGWYVRDIDHGRWGVRETSIRILRAAQSVGASSVGIEKGSLKNAMMDYLLDQMKRIGIFPHIVDLTHGGKKKIERITWALQGRFEHGRIFLKKDAPWIEQLVEQLLDFPNPLSHDDLIDALSYIDQLAQVSYSFDLTTDDWEPLDPLSGY